MALASRLSGLGLEHFCPRFIPDIIAISFLSQTVSVFRCVVHGGVVAIIAYSHKQQRIGPVSRFSPFNCVRHLEAGHSSRPIDRLQYVFTLCVTL